MSRRRDFLSGLAAALSAAFPAVSLGQSGILRVAGNASDSYAEAVYAQDQGFFTKAGLKVDLSILSSGSTIAAAVASGSVDIGISNVVPIALAREHGIHFAYFCSGGMYNPNGAALCVRSDGPIHTAKDLQDQTIASTALTDINTLAIRAWADQNGADSTRFRLVEVPFSEMHAALVRGTVAAAPLVEPALTAAKREGDVRLIDPHLYDVFGKDFLVSGWFARNDWLQANASLARSFASVIYETGKWAKTHPNESASILVKVAKLDPSLAYGMSRAPYGTDLRTSMLQSTLDLAYKYKLLAQPINAADLIIKV